MVRETENNVEHPSSGGGSKKTTILNVNDKEEVQIKKKYIFVLFVPETLLYHSGF